MYKLHSITKYWRFDHGVVQTITKTFLRSIVELLAGMIHVTETAAGTFPLPGWGMAPLLRVLNSAMQGAPSSLPQGGTVLTFTLTGPSSHFALSLEEGLLSLGVSIPQPLVYDLAEKIASSCASLVNPQEPRPPHTSRQVNVWLPAQALSLLVSCYD